MNRSRRHAYDVRTGRRPTSPELGGDGPSAAAATAAYARLLARLARLRAALTADTTGSRPLADVRQDHADLDRSLTDAITAAFAADALGAPPPEGMTSWAAEGVARSQERELALFAAADVSGLLRAATVVGPRWGNVDDKEHRRHSSP
jgi:hypothetical protein